MRDSRDTDTLTFTNSTPCWSTVWASSALSLSFPRCRCQRISRVFLAMHLHIQPVWNSGVNLSESHTFPSVLLAQEGYGLYPGGL